MYEMFVSYLFSDHGVTSVVKSRQMPMLEVEVGGVLLKVYSTPTVAAYTGNLASLQVMFYTKGITQVMFYTKGITQVCYSRCTPLPPWLPILATWPHCRSCSILKVLHRSCSILKVLHRCATQGVLHSHRGCLHWQPGLPAGHVLY